MGVDESTEENIVEKQHSFGQIIKVGKYSKYILIPPGILQASEDAGREVLLAEPSLRRIQRWATQKWDPFGWLRAEWKPLEWADEPLWDRQSFLVESVAYEDGRMVLTLTPTGLYFEETRGRKRSG